MNPNGNLCDQNVTRMRYREPFTIFPRKLKSGKTIWYYRTYAPTGERTVAHSTGQTNKTLARRYCSELLEKGLLYTGTSITFAAFAEHFYDDNSEWMLDKIQTGGGKNVISKSTLKLYRHLNKNMLIPFFGKIKLYDLKTAHIKQYRAEASENGYSNNTINSSIACMKVIIKSAMANRLMTFDPFITVKPMFIAAHERDAYTLNELKGMFLKDWGEDRDIRLFSAVAAVTGMRLGEVTAIRSAHLYDNYIEVSDQIDRFGELIAVKTNEARKIRICETLYKILKKLTDKTDYAFLSRNTRQRDIFYKHCLINKEERLRRKLTFHSLRHFFNTYMLTNGIPEIKVKAIMGHSSGRGSMTERYTNFRPEHFDDVAKLQEELLKSFGISEADVP